MDEINKRIIEWMIKSGHSKSTFARDLGVSIPLITHITTGRNKPGLDLIQRLLTTFPTLSPDWLLNGIGSMHRVEASKPDLSTSLAELDSIRQETLKTRSPLATVMAYHKLLLDEILHIQEMNLEISKTDQELEIISRKLDAVKKRITSELKDEL